MKFLGILKKKKWLVLGIVLVIVIGLGIFFTQTRKDTETLTFISPARQEIIETLEISGTVDALQKARLRFIAGGKITYLSAQEGDEIKKWQTIATIDPASLQKSLEKTLNLYSQERWDWEERVDTTKYRWLNDVERRDKDQAQWDLENTVLDVEIQDIAIKNTRLTAPFAGILTSSPITSAGTQLLATDYFELVDPTSLIFVGRVDEADVARIAEGQTANIRLDAFADETFATTVDRISFASSQTADGTVFTVHFPLLSSNDNLRFRLGMNGEATIELSKVANALTIPLNATRVREGKIYADIQTGQNKTEEREITIGTETDDLVEVLSGLNEADKVLLPE